MGRKGIGKLFLFSMANEIIVETIRDEERSTFRMRLDDIREAIKDGSGTYEPEPLNDSRIDLEIGTRITPGQVKKRQTTSTVEGLRKRLARRFLIIGSINDFDIVVNDKPIAPEDRGYYDKLQYIWTYGDPSPLLDLCTSLEKSEQRANTNLAAFVTRCPPWPCRRFRARPPARERLASATGPWPADA